MNLVIGGSGFIGTHLVHELLAAGEKVRVFDRCIFPSTLEPQPHEMALGDIMDPAELLSAMTDCSTVYHLAGTPELWSRDPRIFDRLNRQGTENVIQAVRQAQVKRFVFTSTESILSSVDATAVINEDVKPKLEDMPGPYCRSKFLAEQAVFQAIEKGLNAVVVCPTLPIGPGDRNLTPPGQMTADFLQGNIPAYLDGTLNFADVRDMAVWHHRAAKHGEVGRRYILSGYNLSIYQFFQMLSQESGRPCPKIRIPYPIALGWSYIEDFYGRMSGRKPQSSVTGVKLCKRSMSFDGSRTWNSLGHWPRPLKESIRDTVAWHRERLAVV